MTTDELNDLPVGLISSRQDVDSSAKLLELTLEVRGTSEPRFVVKLNSLPFQSEP